MGLSVASRDWVDVTSAAVARDFTGGTWLFDSLISHGGMDPEMELEDCIELAQEAKSEPQHDSESAMGLCAILGLWSPWAACGHEHKELGSILSTRQPGGLTMRYEWRLPKHTGLPTYLRRGPNEVAWGSTDKGWLVRVAPSVKVPRVFEVPQLGDGKRWWLVSGQFLFVCVTGDGLVGTTRRGDEFVVHWLGPLH